MEFCYIASVGLFHIKPVANDENQLSFLEIIMFKSYTNNIDVLLDRKIQLEIRS